MKRSGFSLVELVFAIIVIAISLMSVPMLLGESQKSNQYALIQESVMAARTKLGNILTYPWDHNSTVRNSSGAITGVAMVDVPLDDAELDRIPATMYRRGNIHDPKRRRFHMNVVNATAIGHEPGETNITDIDDFNGTNVSVALTGGAGVVGDFDYLGANDLNISTRVYFLYDTANYQGNIARTLNFDFNVSNTIPDVLTQAPNNMRSNIKMIELSVQNAYSADPFILRAFSCNIGGLSELHSEVK